MLAATIGDWTLDRLDPGRLASAIGLCFAGVAYVLFAISSLAVIPSDTRGEVLRLLPGPIRKRIPTAWIPKPKDS
jgi:hypothetical protein